MILDFKFFTYFFLILLGSYFFYNEYQNLSNFKIITKEEKVEITSEIENKKNNKLNILKSENDHLEEINKDNLHFSKKEIVVSKGDNLSIILNKFNLPENKVFEIINEVGKFFDLRRLRIGQKINFLLNSKNEVQIIEIYEDIDTLLVINTQKEIKIERKILEKEFYKTSKEFTIYESLYSDGIKNEIPQKILIDLIKLFSFDLDFQRDIKVNTNVSISYDFMEIKDTNQIKYQDINYALISIDGKILEYFKFLTDDGFYDYFNREGKNVKKSILKTPLDGARISSNFGMRKHPISGYNKMHKGVDFAAPKGTPIYAGGNGVIEYIGNNGGYGKYIRIRHNNEYKTAYAHLSAYKKGISKGSRVNQGDIIGFVGSTGNSTGPHLHYEIIYQNKQINPLKLKLPSGKILVGNELNRFEKEFKRIYADHLNLLYE